MSGLLASFLRLGVRCNFMGDASDVQMDDLQ